MPQHRLPLRAPARRLSLPVSPKDPARAQALRELRAGLRSRPRTLPSKYFYDAAGSALFERITALPEYYLTGAEDRLASLREAFRILEAGGIVVVAAISRYASALDGRAQKLSCDPRFVAIRNRDLAEGQHRNDTGDPVYFTTAYFHRPDDLRAEMEAAGFVDVRVLGVEGPGWILSDFEARWEDPALRWDLIEVAQALQEEPTVIGASAHLLGIGRK